MAHNIQGILVELLTDTGTHAGTDDHIYVGVFGKGGGSEFPLDVRGFNDFEKGTNVKYWFGDVWEGGVLAGAKRPYQAGSWNDPGPRFIDLEEVDYVYLRKHSHKGASDDDAWKMDKVEVTLYGSSSPQKRTFHKTGDIWLANEFGLQVWLKERQAVYRKGLPNKCISGLSPFELAEGLYWDFPEPEPPPIFINIPTLSQWGLIAMAGILGIAGFMVMRRRKVTA